MLSHAHKFSRGTVGQSEVVRMSFACCFRCKSFLGICTPLVYKLRCNKLIYLRAVLIILY